MEAKNKKKQATQLNTKANASTKKEAQQALYDSYWINSM